MTLKNLIEGHVTSVYLNQDHFAEPVSYRPEIGSPRTINAVVDEVTGNRNTADNHTTLKRTIQTWVARAGATELDKFRRGDRLQWQGVWWSNPEIVSGDANSQTIRWELPVVEGSGRAKSGRL